MKYAEQLCMDKLTPSWAFTGMVTGGWHGLATCTEGRDKITRLARSHISLKGDWTFCPISKSKRTSEFDCYCDPFGDNFLNHQFPAKPKSKLGYFLKRQNKGRLEHTMLTRSNAYAFIVK